MSVIDPTVGKRQFSQLMDSLGGNKENTALRNVRTKREADEAGSYTLIFHCECL